MRDEAEAKEECASEKGFQVKDRRRFDEAGNLKDVSSDSSSSSEAPKPELASKEEYSENSGSKDFVMNESSSSESGSSPMDFSSFLLSLATQAMVQLGEMPPPPGVEIPKNREAARHTIDVIEMLENKTAGNLSETEKKLLDEILHSLRIGYVRSES